MLFWGIDRSNYVGKVVFAKDIVRIRMRGLGFFFHSRRFSNRITSHLDHTYHSR